MTSPPMARCCKHADCGGVTHQNGRYEVRAGSAPIQGTADSYPKEGAGGLNARTAGATLSLRAHHSPLNVLKDNTIVAVIEHVQMNTRT